MPRAEDSVSPRFVAARFRCTRCGDEAAPLTLVARGLGHRLVIDAGRLSTTIGAVGVLDDLAFARTPASADPAVIFAVLDVAS